MSGLAFVALGGAVGAVARYGVQLGFARAGLTGWPWATLSVNVLGGLAIGLVTGWLALRAGHGQGQGLSLFLTTGVLGGFTTFSAFSLDVVRFLEAGQWSRAAGYAVVSVVVSVLAVMAGLWLARRGLA